MAWLIRVLTTANAVLLFGMWVTGFLRPEILGTPDEVHMPMGLLTCVLTLLVQAQFLSFLITTSWDVLHFAECKKLDSSVAQRAREIKSASLPWIALVALGVVAAGILGMGARAMVFPSEWHRWVTGLTFLASLGAAYWQPRAAEELEALMGELGLTDSVRQSLGNR